MTQETWGQAREKLVARLGRHNYTSWIEPLKLSALAAGGSDYPMAVLKRGPQGWRRIGNLLLPFNCPATREALRTGRFRVVPPVLRELEIAGARYRMDVDDKVPECGEAKKAGAPPAS